MSHRCLNGAKLAHIGIQCPQLPPEGNVCRLLVIEKTAQLLAQEFGLAGEFLGGGGGLC